MRDLSRESSVHTSFLGFPVGFTTCDLSEQLLVGIPAFGHTGTKLAQSMGLFPAFEGEGCHGQGAEQTREDCFLRPSRPARLSAAGSWRMDAIGLPAAHRCVTRRSGFRMPFRRTSDFSRSVPIDGGAVLGVLRERPLGGTCIIMATAARPHPAPGGQTPQRNQVRALVRTKRKPAQSVRSCTSEQDDKRSTEF